MSALTHGRVDGLHKLGYLRTMRPSPSFSKKAVTLDDVAAVAGVSAKTVSRVVNCDGKVRAETRERIELAIRETGYRVNMAARSLAASRSYLIGTLIPDIGSFYFTEIFRGAAKGCRHHGYHLVVEEFDFGSTTVVDRYEQGLRGTNCDALLLTPPLCDDAQLLEALERDGIPYVQISPTVLRGGVTAICADDRLGVEQLAHHLWNTGRRNFAIIAGPADHAAAAIREASFADTIASLGGDPAAIIVIRPEWMGSIVEIGWQAARELLKDANRRPDAIFAFNDEVAIGALGCARELGLAVPQDIAIAGFDDSYVAHLAWPSLTTIHQPIAAMAFEAIGVIAGARNDGIERILLPTTLTVRDSA